MARAYATGTLNGCELVAATRKTRGKRDKKVECIYQRLPSVQRSRPAEGVPSSAPPPLDEPSSQTNTWPERSKSRSVGVKRRVMSGKMPRRTASKIRCASLALRISDKRAPGWLDDLAERWSSTHGFSNECSASARELEAEGNCKQQQT